MDLLTLLPTLIGGLLMCVSIPLITHPVALSKNYIHIETPQAAFYARQLGIRSEYLSFPTPALHHLMIGTAISALAYKGLIQSAAIVLCCFPILGVLDPVAGWMYRGHLVKNDYNHLVMGCVFGGIGLWILGEVQ
ncbi:uncharacterized protein RCO7_15144 [Rhynchosporium graminicola]|uniref:DUF4267 domain-containing protein n=1 Tax=Rhynchosporium graminicola TaxID=2792576 RepID=A0A1E1LM83_9HELO|nr:uncharacterized protein RCO7_15144 [Rhynchosporium commune]